MPKFASVHPDTMIDLFLATRITGHEAASIARTYGNIIVSGAWWHAFTPTTLSSFYRDRLEMLPNTAWNAFFSDGYIVEWIYAKLQLAKKCLTYTLSELVDEGFDIGIRESWQGTGDNINVISHHHLPVISY